jgi:hypothetical protein
VDARLASGLPRFLLATLNSRPKASVRSSDLASSPMGGNGETVQCNRLNLRSGYHSTKDFSELTFSAYRPRGSSSLRRSGGSNRGHARQS